MVWDKNLNRKQGLKSSNFNLHILWSKSRKWLRSIGFLDSNDELNGLSNNLGCYWDRAIFQSEGRRDGGETKSW